MKLKFAIAATALLSASTAYSDTVNLTYNNFAEGYEFVNIGSVPTGVTVAGSSTDVAAGTFSMTDTTGDLGTFLAWCLDLGSFLGNGGEYEITDTPFQNGGFDLTSIGTDSLTGIQRVSTVFNANYGASIIEDSVNSAAFQLALWEAAYDSDFDLAGGSFRATSTNAGTQAAFYLSEAKDYDGEDKWNTLFLESTEGVDGVDRTQHLVTVAPVPLPASVLMLLAALGAMGMTARRRQAV